MPFLLYDYVNAQDVNEFKKWTASLQKKEIARLNEKLDMLELTGLALLPLTLAATNVPGILKIKVHGQVQLRPLLCKGPIHDEEAFTLLAGAKERGFKLLPKGIEAEAKSRKAAVKNDPAKRRTAHVEITDKAD